MDSLTLRQTLCGAIATTFSEGLREMPFAAQINIRGNAEDPDFSSAIQSCIGLELPTTPNRVSTGETAKALWLSPDEWLVIAEDQKQNDLVWKLEKALADQHAAVNDVSANRTIFELSGPHIQKVMMKSSEIDYHPRVFKPGDCVQTLIAKSQAIVEFTNQETFHIYVRCSFSRYVGAWLAEAFQEYK